MAFQCDAEYHNKPINVTRSTLPAVSAYRSSTSDWLTPEIIRLGEMKTQYGEDATSLRAVSTDCIAYPRPAPRKIGRLLLELLKNLEGDQSTQVLELIQVLFRNNILVETSMLEMEPNLGSLVKTQGVMMGEPHATFPRILAVVWILATNGNHGWCYIDKMNEYLTISKPREIAHQMKTIEPVLARARYVMEDFIQSITPVNMYQKKTSRNTFKYPTTQTKRITTKTKVTSKKRHAIKQRANPTVSFELAC
ncbi:uncharacterized protein LOC112050762 [Bicyclus anynana]|uniref:Uncharacterized protein LOC112050762 n=1 Tax=Bicyclus anynana TaxID=110368 RepID=A0ABM3LZK7_BICAN|nr:uncharacterized protein LOC112050762 [Bicyclus anynana]